MTAVLLDTVELMSYCIQKRKYFDFERKHKFQTQTQTELKKHTMLAWKTFKFQRTAGSLTLRGDKASSGN